MVILRTESPATTAVAEVSLAGTCVSVIFREKSERFRTTIRGAGFRWSMGNYCWELDLDATTGDPEHRVIETTHALLAADISVEVDEAFQQRIADADYEPMCRHWISRRDDTLLITMPYGDDAFDAAMSIPGARYSRALSGVALPFTRFNEARDFAESCSFSISECATEAMTSAERSAGEAIVVTAKAKVAARPSKQANSGIATELLDS